jgi:hypothetical protein
MGFQQAVCVCSFCSLLVLEGVGLAVYLALLTRLRLVLARRKRLALVLGWLLIMSGLVLVCVFVMCMSMLTRCKA